MGEGFTSAVTIPRSSAAVAGGASSSIRFLGLLKQPESPDYNVQSGSALELDESDVVWSSSDDHSSPSSTSSPGLTSPSPVQRTSHPFIPATFGLSSLLDSSSPTGTGLIWRQPSPITPAVAVPMLISSPPVRKSFNQSAPVAVPVWSGRRRDHGRKGRRVEPLDEGTWGSEEEGEDQRDGKEEDEEEEMEGIVPPHLIVARSHVTSFSMLEGVGRTLKGRDLRRVRNAVLQETGFLDLGGRSRDAA